MLLNPEKNNDGLRSKKEITIIQIKAEVDIEYCVISKDALENLQEASGSSTAFDLSLFFFSLSIAFFIAIVTMDIKSIFLYTVLIFLAASMFVAGLLKYLAYRKNKKTVYKILEKVRRQRCYLK